MLNEPLSREIPPKPFRSLIRKPKLRLTTIIAVEARDGLVMGADSQQTGWMKEITNKVEFILPNVLLGCAGSSQYIDVLSTTINKALHDRESKPKGKRLGYNLTLNAAVDKYGKQMAKRIDELKLRGLPNFDIRDYYPEGLCAVCRTSPNQKKSAYYSIYEIKTPHPCLDALPRFRAAVGSGGDVANVFLKTFEDYMEPFGLKWVDFSANTIRLLVGQLLQRVARVDPYSSGVDIWTLKPDGVEREPVEHHPDQSNLSSLVSSFISELPPETLADIVSRSGLREILERLRLG